MKNGDMGGRGRHPNDPTGEIYGDEHWPLPMEHEKPAGALYVILDITEPQATYAVAIGTMEQVQLMGRLLKAAGKNVIAPPCENRGLSCLNLKQLQYLYWNTCKQVPSEVYADLILATSKVVFALPPDQTPIEILREQVRALTPTGEATPDAEPVVVETKSAAPAKPAPASRAKSVAPPAGTTTTGRVWAIAEQALLELGSDWKEVRAKVMATCEAQGINKATAATQYSKFKASKSS